jgi:hypothetical protein
MQPSYAVTKKARKSSRYHSIHGHEHNYNRISSTKISAAARQGLANMVYRRLLGPLAGVLSGGRNYE